MIANSTRAARRCTVLLIAGALALFIAPTAHSQVAVGDSLWQAGKTSEAVAAYRRAVELDRNSVRANFRIAQALAWSSNTDSALAYLRNARARVPNDPDLQFAEATYLAWGRRFDAALVQYDSILAAHPGRDFDYVRIARARTLSWAGELDAAAAGYHAVLSADSTNRDARFGLAQVSAWSGDLDGAMTDYQALTRDDPTETRVLVAMAQVRLWQGRSGAARAIIDRVLPADTANPDVVAVRKAIAEARATTVGTTASWSHDHDDNRNAWQQLTIQGVAGDATRYTLTLGYLGATDPYRNSYRSLGEIAASLPVGRGNVSAAVGARNLDPAPTNPSLPRPAGRAVATGRIGLSQRVAPGLTLGASAARWPFDEVAALMGLRLDVTQLDVTADWRVKPAITVSGGGTHLHFSDGNARMTWSGRVAWRLPSGFSVGAYGTQFGYDFKAPHYFSPNDFRAAEATAGWNHESTEWTAFLGGGYGGQKVDTAAVQTQWHVDARASRRVARRWWIDVSGGTTTSAAATAIGAYRYNVVTIGLRRLF